MPKLISTQFLWKNFSGGQRFFFFSSRTPLALSVVFSAFLFPSKSLIAWTDFSSWKEWVFGEGDMRSNDLELGVDPSGRSENLNEKKEGTPPCDTPQAFLPPPEEIISSDEEPPPLIIEDFSKNFLPPQSEESSLGSSNAGEEVKKPEQHKSDTQKEKRENKGKEEEPIARKSTGCTSPIPWGEVGTTFLSKALRSIYFDSSRGVSRLIFSRFFSSPFEREPVFASFFSSFQRKTAPGNQSFAVRKVGGFWGGECGSASKSFGFCFSYQQVVSVFSGWKLRANDFCAGLFGSFFEDRPVRLVYSFIGGPSFSKAFSFSGDRSEARLVFLTATGSVGSILDFSAAGLSWLSIFAKGDLFLGRGSNAFAKKRRQLTRALFSGECGLYLGKNFLREGKKFFSPHLSLSYARCAAPFKHLVFSEVGCKVGKLYGFSLDFSLRGEAWAHYRGGGFSLCAGF